MTPAEYLQPEKLRGLLLTARSVELGLSQEQFQQVVSLQKRLKRDGYAAFSSQESELAAELWQRVREYVRLEQPGYKHLVWLFILSGSQVH